MRKIVGIGETVLDVIFKGGRPVAAVPGGSTFNSLVSLGRTAAVQWPSVKVVMLSRFGDDLVGKLVSDFMGTNHMSTEGIILEEGRQSNISLAFLNEKNDANYEFFRDSKTGGGSDLKDISFEAGDILMFGSFFAVNPALRSSVKALVRKARESGAIVYYDVNFRKSHIQELSQIKTFVEENCAMCDYVRCSQEDIENLYGCSDGALVYSGHIEPLCRNFICTHGALPVEVFSPGIHRLYPVPRVNTVSTIGAGDNFNAGFVYALVRYGFFKDVAENMNEAAWTLTVKYARRFSSAVCRSIYNYVDEGFLAKL